LQLDFVRKWRFYRKAVEASEKNKFIPGYTKGLNTIVVG
jgi:hypothetical protein